MSANVTLLILLAVTLLYTVLSRPIARSIITLPMIFTVLGYLVFLATDHMDQSGGFRHTAKIVAEVTLILILFADASHVRFKRLATSYVIPLRMLLIGMPLTVMLGALVAHWVSPDLSWAIAFLVAAILTPTDAAIGQSVVSSAEVPSQLAQAINVESGLNDGFALPVVLIAASMASVGLAHGSDSTVFEITILPIVLGPITGALVGWCAGLALDRAEQANSILTSCEGIFFLAAAFMAFLLAEIVGGNGFIAAFVGGMVFGNTYKGRVEFIGEFMEGQGQIMIMASFFIFGFILVPQGLEHANLKTVTLALLFLTLVRIIPIVISLYGTGMRFREKLFLGWFGPRGLASVLFALLIVEQYEVAGKEEILACVVLTVILSIALHGITAAPLAHRIRR